MNIIQSIKIYVFYKNQERKRIKATVKLKERAQKE